MAYQLISNGTLIDGTGAKPIKDGAVLIHDQHILFAGHASSLVLPAGPIKEINAQGGFILPGLIDTHVHLMFEGVNIPKILSTPFSFNFYQAEKYMERTIDAGITTVRDAGGADFGVKQALDQGLIRGPRAQISISVLGITGGHVDFWMRSGQKIDLYMPPYPGHPGITVLADGVEEVRKKVREILRAGADVIKVCSTGGVSSPTDHPNFTQYSEAELRVMVEEAAFRNGRKVMAHAQGTEGIKNAVRAGIHSIEHGIYLDDEVIELMLEKGTYLVPTLLAPVAVLEQSETAGMPPWAVEKAKEVLEAHAESIAKAYKAGVRIAMGTDAAVMPHGTNLRELGLMVSIGMDPMEVIVATTKTAAECLGWDDKVGTIEPGKFADMIITSTDPLNNIRSLEDQRNIPFVMKGGQVMKNTMAIPMRN